jgi:N-dimethylarginine dimethylaminohydrolase
MLEQVDPPRAREQHDAIADAYRRAGVRVHLVDPVGEEGGVPPNLMFVADLFFMTPEGAVLGRPAAEARAGEERHVARRLADLGIPVLLSVRGSGTFEGADAMHIAPGHVLLARGLRTNAEGARQVQVLLGELDLRVTIVDLVPGTMHLMGVLRIPVQGRAFVWSGRFPEEALRALQASGHEVFGMPDEQELAGGMALNFVTLRPGHVLMPEGNPRSRAFLEDHGVRCDTVEVDELAKAAGGIGCLTGVMERALAGEGE